MTTSGDTTSYVPPQLLNPLASETDAAEPPSLQDGVPRDLELDLRAYGAQVIHRLGQLLSLPQRVTATSQVLFQRFWYTTSFAQFSCLDVAVAAVFLSSKLEERPIPTRDLINCYDYILQRHRRLSSQSGGSSWTRNGDSKWMPPTPQNFSSSNPTRPAYQPHTHHSDTYYEFKDSLVVHEMQILKRLGFQMEALLPYAALVNYLQVLGLGRDRDVVQECWARCSDMLQTPLPALLPPHILSVAAIYFLSLQPDSPAHHLPRHPAPWWTLFDVRIEELRVVCAWLQRLYDDQDGTASRVKDEWGGLVELGTKAELRRWIATRQQKQEPQVSNVTTEHDVDSKPS